MLNKEHIITIAQHKGLVQLFYDGQLFCQAATENLALKSFILRYMPNELKLLDKRNHTHLDYYSYSSDNKFISYNSYVQDCAITIFSGAGWLDLLKIIKDCGYKFAPVEVQRNYTHYLLKEIRPYNKLKFVSHFHPCIFTIISTKKTFVVAGSLFRAEVDNDFTFDNLEWIKLSL
jgi:hypothetical protein